MMKTVETDLYWTAPEAAVELGVSDAAIRVAIKSGGLAATKVMGRNWILKTDLEEYRQRTQQGGKAKRGRPAGVKDRTPRPPRKKLDTEKGTPDA